MIANNTSLEIKSFFVASHISAIVITLPMVKDLNSNDFFVELKVSVCKESHVE